MEKMKNKYDIERERIFNRYNKNLNLIINAYPNTFGRLKKDLYYCPLCLHGFDIKATVGPKPNLTLEHVIPKNMDGTKKVLTCQSCNNNMGSKVDVLLTEHINALKFFKNEPQLKINSRFGFENGINIKGSVSHMDDSGKKLLLYSNMGDNKFLEQITSVQNKI